MKKIQELQKLNTDIKFIEVDSINDKARATINNLDELLKIDNTFLVLEDILEQDDAIEFIIEDLIDSVKTELYMFALFKERKAIEEDLDEVVDLYSDDLQKLCGRAKVSSITIRSLNYNIEYSKEENSINETKKEELKTWIEEKRLEVAAQREAEEKEYLDKIQAFVDSKLDEYRACTSQSAKEKLIKNIRFSIKEQFELYDGNFTRKDYLDYYLNSKLLENLKD